MRLRHRVVIRVFYYQDQCNVKRRSPVDEEIYILRFIFDVFFSFTSCARTRAAQWSSLEEMDPAFAGRSELISAH